MDAAVIVSAVGLELSARTFPGGAAVRDAGHAKKLVELMRHAAAPLRIRFEVPLPERVGVIEQRNWDATISDLNETTGVELESALYDVQSQTRRIQNKRRQGVDRLLVVVADTNRNRRVLREFPDYFAEWPRLRTATVIAELEAGRLPPTGLILF